jgi:hypothetical protein
MIFATIRASWIELITLVVHKAAFPDNAARAYDNRGFHTFKVGKDAVIVSLADWACE